MRFLIHQRADPKRGHVGINHVAARVVVVVVTIMAIVMIRVVAIVALVVPKHHSIPSRWRKHPVT